MVLICANDPPLRRVLFLGDGPCRFKYSMAVFCVWPGRDVIRPASPLGQMPGNARQRSVSPLFSPQRRSNLERRALEAEGRAGFETFEIAAARRTRGGSHALRGGCVAGMSKAFA